MDHRQLKVVPIQFLLALIVVASTSCFSVRSGPRFTYEKLGPNVYQELLADSADHIVIDVRTKGEYERSHINGAVNHSYLAFNYRKKLRAMDRNKLVFLYCQTCHRSPLAARKLKHMGFRRVVDLKGGYRLWHERNSIPDHSVE